MDRFIQIYESRPIAMGLMLTLFFAMFAMFAMLAMLIAWRKDAEFLTAERKDCPAEHLLKRDMFNYAKWLIVFLALFSVLVKF